MTNKDFVAIVREKLVVPTVQDVIENLTLPIGRKPDESSVRMSNWYNSLPDSDKDYISKVIHEAVESSVFHFLCILDGVSAIEPAGDKGKLELFFVKNGQKTLINDFEEEFLHDLFFE